MINLRLMDSNLPIHENAKSKPFARAANQHARTTPAHLVKDSFTTRLSKLKCAIFLSFLFIVGLVTFVLCLSLRPQFFIHDFLVPGLGLDNGFHNAHIAFNVTARNSNLNIGIYYDSITVSVYYKDLKIGFTSLLDSYYEGPKTTRSLAAVLSGAKLNVTSQRWMEFNKNRLGGPWFFGWRVHRPSGSGYPWDSKRHGMHANYDVSVGPHGMILPSFNDIRCPVYFT